MVNRRIRWPTTGRAGLGISHRAARRHDGSMVNHIPVELGSVEADPVGLVAGWDGSGDIDPATVPTAPLKAGGLPKGATDLRRGGHRRQSLHRRLGERQATSYIV